ncbi:hypothetical protein EVG20_g10597 [Dentipellis fragilis]|uniref:Uncharacterized protein n=1 Tax=Dentipellis fragilis TaxID=205917 RepID=A0A4Y9XSE5_9AGAM|nr:hypothetical protein EVG20_g10597 [Dentipellis fragilis]
MRRRWDEIELATNSEEKAIKYNPGSVDVVTLGPVTDRCSDPVVAKKTGPLRNNGYTTSHAVKVASKAEGEDKAITSPNETHRRQSRARLEGGPRHDKSADVDAGAKSDVIKESNESTPSCEDNVEEGTDGRGVIGQRRLSAFRLISAL